MKHIVLLVPGLGDRVSELSWLTKPWAKDDIMVIVHSAEWKNTKESFQIKLDHLLKHIDALANKNTELTLIGTSAGGSLVINAFARRKNKIHRVINICGRVRKGNNVFPSLKMAAREFQAFYESVVACEKELPKLTNADKAKIMTTRPFPFDGHVPMSCIQIQDATNCTVPIPTHMLGITFSLTFYKNHLIQFIKE